MKPSLFALLATTTFLTTPLDADDFTEHRDRNWHQWRGPLANGVAPHGEPPTQWDDETNIRWKTAIPGLGSSTPIIWKDKIFLTTAVLTERIPSVVPLANPDAKTKPPDKAYRFEVLCLARASGKIIWKQTAKFAAPHEGRHPTNSYASASPVTDGKRLYVSFGSRGIYCYRLDGALLWTRDIGKMRTRYGWGEAASPTVYGGSLVVNWDHEDQSAIMVLDAESGSMNWKADRDEPTSWSTPLIVKHKGRVQVIVNATNRVRSYDLESGKVIWQCGGQTTNTIPSPVATKESVVCMSFYGQSMACAIPLSSKGDVTDSDNLLWRYRRGTPYVPSPVLVNHRLYFTQSNNGVLTCLDVNSGKRLFGPERLPAIRQMYASPSSAGGHVYFAGRDGNVVVIKDADQFEVVAWNQIGEPVDASPVIAGNELFIRGRKHLFCIAEDKRD